MIIMFYCHICILLISSSPMIYIYIYYKTWGECMGRWAHCFPQWAWHIVLHCLGLPRQKGLGKSPWMSEPVGWPWIPVGIFKDSTQKHLITIIFFCYIHVLLINASLMIYICYIKHKGKWAHVETVSLNIMSHCLGIAKTLGESHTGGQEHMDIWALSSGHRMGIARNACRFQVRGSTQQKKKWNDYLTIFMFVLLTSINIFPRSFYFLSMKFWQLS